MRNQGAKSIKSTDCDRDMHTKQRLNEHVDGGQTSHVLTATKSSAQFQQTSGLIC